MIRAFFAAEISDDARRAAAALIRELREAPDGDEVRWVRPETLHVTLRFLGDVEPDRVAELAARVGEALADAAPFELRLGEAVAFPSPRRPRVVALGVAPEEPLVELAGRVERGVVAAGLPPEERRFRAHLTLGRLRGRRLPELASVPAPEASPFAVDEVVLFSSELRPEGALHTPLERIALGGHDSPATRSSEGEMHGKERANY